MQKLDERDFRRQDFSGGVPIVLADGQEWYFAEPLVRFVPSDSDVGFEVCMSLGGDDALDDLYTQYTMLMFLPPDAIAGRTDDYVGSEMKMARMLLDRNYDLTVEQVRGILQFSHDKKRDPEGCRIRTEVLAILAGSPPKPSAGGDAPSHTPPAVSGSATA